MDVVAAALRVMLSCTLCASLGVQAQDAERIPSAVHDPVFGKLAQAPDLKESDGKWAGSLGLGVTLRRGSTSATEGSLSLDAERTMRDSRLFASLIAVHSAENGERSSDTMTGDLRGERKLGERQFGFVGLGLERDALQDMTARGSLSTGLGMRWLNAETHALTLYGGLAYSFEHYRASEDAKGVESLFGAEWRYEISPTSRISQRLVVYPASIRGGARLALQGSLTTRINSHFGLQVAVLQKYRETIRDQNSHADTVFFTGITTGF
ncbi:MAG: DUF481 domain-containing protein [Uliginosibacterium sp.]|jgi:putative salt-induced outer membrane protein YdiY|nr:DUF481 domain-containing protein [Uliginosibacterium sp.]MBK9617297.1 DUF481 domain-containing protein [Uliginosibacterium sp.]